MFVIWDIDNCIADDEWRIPLIDWTTNNMDARYRWYHALSARDSAGNRHAWAQAAEAGAAPVFITSRPEYVRAQTQAWILNRLGVQATDLYMRPRGNHRPSVDFKRACLRGDHRLVPGRVLFAYDDRPDIVDMYCSMGLDGRLLKLHDACAYQPKEADK